MKSITITLEMLHSFNYFDEDCCAGTMALRKEGYSESYFNMVSKQRDIIVDLYSKHGNPMADSTDPPLVLSCELPVPELPWTFKPEFTRKNAIFNKP